MNLIIKILLLEVSKLVIASVTFFTFHVISYFSASFAS